MGISKFELPSIVEVRLSRASSHASNMIWSIVMREALNVLEVRLTIVLGPLICCCIMVAGTGHLGVHIWVLTMSCGCPNRFLLTLGRVFDHIFFCPSDPLPASKFSRLELELNCLCLIVQI